MNADVAREVGARLGLISGQVLGVERMLAAGRGVDELLVQSSAIRSALREVARLLLTRHLQQVLGELLGPRRLRAQKAQVDALLSELLRARARVAMEGGAP